MLPQVHELQVVVNKLRVVKIDLPEPFQVGAIIAKLPPSWNGRKRISHNSKVFSLEQIHKHLRIEEESRSRDKTEESYEGTSKANIVSKPKSSSKSNHKKKGILLVLKRITKFKRPKGACFVCGKLGHFDHDCKFRKKPNEEEKANTIKEEIVHVVSDINAIHGNVQGWWYDTCATVHVSYDFLKTYENVTNEHEIHMGNEVPSKVLGKGNVEFFFTSGKKIILANVLYVPDMNRNLVSGDLLIKPGVKTVYELSKLILSKNGIFIGKLYSCDGMMKLCTIDNNGNKNNLWLIWLILFLYGMVD